MFRDVIFVAVIGPLLSLSWLSLSSPPTAAAGDWSESQVARLPAGEQPVRLFNGKDLEGWEGHIGRYFTVENGVIVGRNGDGNAPKSSTYLLTRDKYRNFRLIFESQLVTSEMHSGISLWGKVIEKDEGPFTYQGHLVMYPSGYGYYDLFRRNMLHHDTLGVARRAGAQHGWNRMEILATGHRIRHVINGHLVADWSDPQPELCETGPIGLQLHSNTVAQELRWRGLILTEDPRDQLVTAESYDTGLIVDGKPAESGMDADALAAISERMRKLAEDGQMAGAVTLVARRGRVVQTGATGKADMASGRDMAPNTVFAIASMTKPVTAAAVAVLMDDGSLRLDDPVSKYIPAFADTKLAGGQKPKREITIRDCLTHTNGLVSDQKNQGSLANTAELLAKSELAFEPGSKWQYGPGLSVAGRVVEVVSGKSFDQFLADRIFMPLEMHDTTFIPSEEQRGRIATLYQPAAGGAGLEPGSHWLFDLAADTTPNPSGGLYSTAGDLVRFHQMVLNGGDLNGRRILTPDSVRQMTSVQTGELSTGTTPGVGWGLGFSMIRDPQGGCEGFSPGSYGHGGAFGTQGWVDPQRQMITILLIARQGFPPEKAVDLRGELQRLAVAAIRD